MKPVNGPTSYPDVFPIKTENDENSCHRTLLDAYRNNYLSEKSGDVFCQLETFKELVGPDRQAVIEEMVVKFLNLTEEERLLFFLRLPVYGQSTNNSYTKLGIFATRVEIRRTSAWIRSHLEEDNDAAIPKRDVYDKYLEHCQASRMIPISIADFGKVMKHMYPSVRPRRLGMRGRSQYCYAGMGSCKHVSRPEIYENDVIDDFECARLEEGRGMDYPCEQPFNAESGQPVAFLTDEATLAKCPRSYVDPVDLEEQKRKVCPRSRRKLSQAKSLKELSSFVAEQPADGEEEEVAQYFKNDFRRPLKLVKGSSTRCSAENKFYSSREIPSLEDRSQSSVDWPSYESPFFRRSNSHNEAVLHSRSVSRLATEQLANLQLRSVSCVSRGSSAEHGCGFTPISPSPVLWTNYTLGELPNTNVYAENKPAEFRPRGYSLNEAKCPLKRDFQYAFDKPGPNIEDEKPWTTEFDPHTSVGYKNEVDQSELPVLPFAPNSEPVPEMTCHELTEMLENSMAVDISGPILPENILPQIDNIFNDIKRDEVENNFETENFQENPLPSVSVVAPFRETYGHYY